MYFTDPYEHNFVLLLISEEHVRLCNSMYVILSRFYLTFGMADGLDSRLIFISMCGRGGIQIKRVILIVLTLLYIRVFSNWRLYVLFYVNGFQWCIHSFHSARIFKVCNSVI